jgi:2,4-dienoyl-CoA reductase-like NADH-dependent reductase (Old Yellow Enzyme family)
MEPSTSSLANLPTRVILAPINCGFASGGSPTDDLHRFHAERSGRSIGLSLVGNVAISLAARSNPRTPVLLGRNLFQFASVARAIQRNGSLAGLQLGFAPSWLHPSKRWRAPDIDDELASLRTGIRGAHVEDLADALDAFVAATDLARRAGFDVVQIHAAHGYLLSLMLSPEVNIRNDDFRLDGPWIERFVSRLLDAAGQARLSFRISTQVGLGSAADELEAAKQLAFRLAVLGVNLIDLSSGYYSLERHLIYPPPSVVPPLYEFARQLALDLRSPVVFAGGVTSPEVLRSLLRDSPENLHIGLGRALIADPEFASKAFDYRDEEITLCGRTGHCHYFTRGREELECGVNPRVGKGT